MRRDRTLALPSLLSLLSLLLLFTLPNAFVVARAAEADERRAVEDDGYEETARVARVSLIRGDVSLRRAGGKKWERAALNVPLVEGDRLATGPDSRVEVQIDARNFLRVGPYSTLDIVTLREEGVALSLSEGTATLRLARFDREREYFEIDAPGTTVAAERRGLYRIDATTEGRVRVTVRDDGRARIYSENSGFNLRDGRTAELSAAGSADEADWNFSDAAASDSWDSWIVEREGYLASRLRYEGRERYYDDNVWGAEELDAYGDWVEHREYGHVWRPRTTVINNYYNWAPYRYGHWNWLPAYGWTWVGDEPWGWAPYHYGRWVHVDNYWCWAPRGHVGYQGRSWWRPALVAFVFVARLGGEHVAWYPLPYHHRDPHSNYWRRALGTDRLRALRRDEIANLRRVNPIYQRAVSSLPAREFGGAHRARPADTEIARKALTGEPVFGKLPVRPVETPGSADAAARTPRERMAGRTPGASRLNDAARTDASASAGDAPTRGLTERPTGAARRQPGVALDGELRRGRVFNNREPLYGRGARPSNGDGARGEGRGTGTGDTRTADEGRNTGAVSRPTRPVRGGADSNGGGEVIDKRATDRVRPVRPVSPDAGDEGAARDGEVKRPEWKSRPVERPGRPDSEGDEGARGYRRERPARPEVRDEKPARPDYRPEPQREEQPPAQRERPEPRYERPERQERPEPRQERQERQERPEPRQEKAEPRQEKSSPPPPQREEKRSDPPARDAPARPAREKPADND